MLYTLLWVLILSPDTSVRFTSNSTGIRHCWKNAEVLLPLKRFTMWYLSHFMGKCDLKAQICCSQLRNREYRFSRIISIAVFQIHLEIWGSIYENITATFKIINAQKWSHLPSTGRIKWHDFCKWYPTRHFLTIKHSPGVTSYEIIWDTSLNSDPIQGKATSSDFIYADSLADFKASAAFTIHRIICRIWPIPCPTSQNLFEWPKVAIIIFHTSALHTMSFSNLEVL